MTGGRPCKAGLRTNCNLTERNKWGGKRDNRYCRCHAHVGDLAKVASGFFLAIGMCVWRDLQKERERTQRQRERHWPGEFAENRMYSEQHFRASPNNCLPEKAPSPQCREGTVLNFLATRSDLQDSFFNGRSHREP